MQITTNDGHVTVNDVQALVTVLNGFEADDIELQFNRAIDMVSVADDLSEITIMANGQDELEMIAAALTLRLGRDVQFNDATWQFLGL